MKGWHRAPNDSTVWIVRCVYLQISSTVEQWFPKPLVVGSIPIFGSSCRKTLKSGGYSEYPNR